MCDAMVHRGPDGHGYLTDGPCSLGHRRLSIIDLRPEAAQPITNEDGSIAAVVNGEIYNFRELRRELEAKGHHFKSRTDSEVVVHLYEQEGPSFLDRLHGMFALALWDRPCRRLLLARDRFGKKPLFYHAGSKGFTFASELAALAASGQFELRANIDAIDEFLCLQYVPSPSTAFEAVHKLPPGCRLICENGHVGGPERYFTLRFDQTTAGSLGELSERLHDHIDEAVRLRMVSDVPLGAFLSGGVDSSLIVAMMAKRSSRPVKTFAVGFTSKDFSELPYARMVAERYGTEHHEIVLQPEMSSIIPELVRHYGEPFADSSSLPTWYLCQYTRHGVTVALSGDGGDEAFAGYRRYGHSRTARLLRKLPEPLPSLLAKMIGNVPTPFAQQVRGFGRRLMQPEHVRFLGLAAHIPQEDRMALYTPAMRDRYGQDRVARRFGKLYEASTASDPVNRLLDLDIQTYLTDDILTKVDIASMAHSLEVRCPLVDQDLMVFAASLPGRLKLRGLTTKRILREVARPLLPEKILTRPKQGFHLPVDRWMREELAGMSRDVLLDRTARERGIFNPTAIESLLHRHQSGEPRGDQIWALVMLELWYREFIDAC
jgi:asparagine synthase (glutamine-hydrolysing)